MTRRTPDAAEAHVLRELIRDLAERTADADLKADLEAILTAGDVARVLAKQPEAPK